MLMTIVAVRDKKCDCFSRPFFAQTPAAAIRSFSDEVNRAHEENPYYKHPEDYALYELGQYNDEDGSINTHALPKLLIQADQTIQEKNYSKPFTAV